jgi:hypothetical protein
MPSYWGLSKSSTSLSSSLLQDHLRSPPSSSSSSSSSKVKIEEVSTELSNQKV